VRNKKPQETNEEPIPKSSFLRWAGSKRKQLPKLATYWNESYGRYVEPFMGSACLFFSLNPSTALLSDLNEELVHTFCMVRDGPKQVYKALMSLPLGKVSYYQVRGKNPNNLSPVNRAARFIYLNRFCFNGIYRTNLKGEFNVPYAPTGTGGLPTLEFLQSIATQLKRSTISCGDFEKILLKEVRKNDFVYMDPPYAVSTRRVFREYGPQPFGFDDVNRLVRLLDEMDRRKAKFVVSYALTNEVLRAFHRWDIKRIVTHRNVSGFAEHRRKAVEILVSNIA